MAPLVSKFEDNLNREEKRTLDRGDTFLILAEIRNTLEARSIELQDSEDVQDVIMEVCESFNHKADEYLFNRVFDNTKSEDKSDS